MKEAPFVSALLERSLRFGLIGILVLLLLFTITYLSVFNNGLSQSSDSWAAFGSFFGGVFGPVVSLVTLFAILVTIELQKGLLSTQRREFDLLNDQQRLSHQVQLQQAEFSKLSEYKSHQLQLLDQQVNMFERMLDRYNAEGERLFELGERTGVPRTGKLEIVDENINEVEGQVGRLIQLSVEISLGEYSTVEEISKRMKEELQDIAPKFFKFS
ncbi:hypothetical protein JFT85_00605 [Pseudomonas sp. TH04]|uniref:hypothetical protein n=1 Tax=Pseudomonas sp. TH04 TaxID=2796370 RepID=UPI00191193BF|nr:hypothetical protein [Pseudomonas sp. TH04]MBK5543265.1 hypothetical protein [Pseudomonas sp. TH04]